MSEGSVFTYLVGSLTLKTCLASIHEVKWALGSTTLNKASGGDGIPAELLKS